MPLLTVDAIQNLAVVSSVIAILTEAIVEMIAKPIIKGRFNNKRSKNKKEQIDKQLRYTSLFISLALAYYLFSTQQPEDFSYITVLLCGFIASRGANYTHNWFDNLPKNQKPEVPSPKNQKVEQDPV